MSIFEVDERYIRSLAQTDDWGDFADYIFFLNLRLGFRSPFHAYIHCKQI